MSITNYYSVGGKLLGQKVQGQAASSRVDYQTDALGSVTATSDQTGTVQNTYRYKPYGSPLAKTGLATDPAFTWVGSYGYREAGTKYSNKYIRARHYNSSIGVWTTQDPANARRYDNLYVYSNSNPITMFDPSGLVPVKGFFYSFIHQDEDRLFSIKPTLILGSCTGQKQNFGTGWIPVPSMNPGGLAYYRSDSRTFNQDPRKTSRVRAVFQVDTCDIGRLDKAKIHHNVGGDLTQGIPVEEYKDGDRCYFYRPAVTQKSIVISDNIANDSPCTDWAFSQFTMTYQAFDALAGIGTPPLRMTVVVKMQVRPGGILAISFDSLHTKYPWHEAYVSAPGIQSKAFIYLTDPRAQTSLCLFAVL